ncbi:MAG: trypsin-like peptidase domain-containing protein [Planctomycetes bacterium]|nr:trypsin-like peptidase domain-containing protein [Planctomycetota bacterium]
MNRGFRGMLVIVCAVGLSVVALAEEPSSQSRRRTPIVEVFERARDAVVNISTTRVERYQPRGFESPFDEIFNFGHPAVQEINSVGSGFVVHESGYVVTNAHVVGQTSDVKVNFADQHTEIARVVAVDSEHDLAVLKVDAPKPLPHLRLGRSDDIMIGETVIAIGNPLGLKHTVTSGIVSALDRELVFSRNATYSGLIQTDAAINPGNSGGPLLNIDGELIGINTAIRGDAQNVGFAIPVDRLWELLPSMLDIEKRQRVKFGLAVNGPDARVSAVRADSPAQKAGVQVGDRLVRFGNQPLRDGIDYYVHLLSAKPGEQVALTLDRKGQSVTSKIPLEAIPPPDGGKLAAQLLGVQLAPIPDSVRRRYRLPADTGVMVSEVIENSPAASAQVEDGDLILSVNRIPVSNVADVGLALEGVQSGENLMLGGARLRASPPFRWDIAIRAGRGR